jgi:predicted GNAT family acetyltransferase
MKVVRHNTASEFLDRAGAWLEIAEAENNLILGIATDLRNYSGTFKIPPYYMTLEEYDLLVGAAFMHPPRQLIVSRMPNEALLTLADYLLSNGAPLSGVNGPSPMADLFAQYWAEKKGHRRLDLNQRIYACENVDNVQRSPGQLRIATQGDEPLLTRWAEGFCQDAGIPNETESTKARIPYWLTKGWLHVWEYREVVSMTSLNRETRQGFAVSLVYTPPHFRNKGYATSCVAALTQRTLDSGKTFCCLYTDHANPTSNSIYQKIGYRPVCDVQDWIFE